MDTAIIKALGELLDEKLAPIKQDIVGMKQDINGMKQDINGMKQDINEIQQEVAGIKQDISGMKQDINGMQEEFTSVKQDINGIKQDMNEMKTDIKFIKVQQEEHGKILRILEDKAITNKADHDKLSNDIAHLSEKVEGMRKDLATVEVVTARNMENIAQLKIIK